jgi:two-component system chemotaxis response regulator CheY
MHDSTLRSILVVDADDEARALYRESLARVGEVVEAADGRDALAKALLREPSLVVTEMRLPFIDGPALCELLRRDPATAGVPILVVTGDAGSAAMQRAKRSGADAVMTKPAPPDRVLETAKVLLARQRPAAQPPPIEETRRKTLSKSHARFETTTPPVPAPALRCPLCDQPLTYERSHVGGVSDRHAEQWDDYVCATCGAFQYRQRTRKLRRRK